MPSRDYFQGKCIAVIGLGPHGEMVADVKFLIKADALVAVYDLRSEARIKENLLLLREVGLANYVCGSIPPDDLLDMDLIILSHEYPRDSSFLKHARERGIPIEYPETLFFKLAPPVMVVGVMGVCGKSTVVSMLEPMLEEACAGHGEQGFFTLDPDSGDGILARLKKAKSGDIVLMRVIEPMMKELIDLRISPHVAIFTTLPAKTSGGGSPFDILAHQTYNNFIVAPDEVVDATHSLGFQPKAKMLRTKPSLIPVDWKIGGKGTHDRDNAALAFQAAKLFKVTDDEARKILEKWKSLKGRLELVKKVKNVEFYNDTASVSPVSTVAGISSLSENRNVVLIFGGANSGYDYRSLYAAIPEYAHTMVVLPGSGTIRERQALRELDKMSIFSAPSIEEATRVALEHSKKGDRVLFSPGFEAGGLDGSRKERGERFVRAVRGL